MKARRIRGLLLILLLSAAAVFAQETAEGEEDFDALFEEEMIEEADESKENNETAPEQAFLVSESVEWGGRIRALGLGSWLWQDLTEPVLFKPDQAAVNTELLLDLFFDARPTQDLRVYGKVKVNQSYDPLQSDYAWEYSLFELFSDFHYQDMVFFRVGKQTVHWGVGYFFSPADVFNLVLIDPEDPDADREGPVALKTQVPVGIHNLYLYLLAKDIERPEDIAVAPKGEVVLGNFEIGLGGYYQCDLPPRILLTLTGPLWDIDLFSEAVLQYGSERTFVSPRPYPLYDTYTIDDWLFSGSIGLSYTNLDWNLSLSGQYFYNGQGYERYSDISLWAKAALVSGDIAVADLYYRSRHYAAATISWSSIFDSDFAVSLFWIGDIVDRSGWLTPTVSWSPLTTATLSASLQYAYGRTRSEYAPFGDFIKTSIEISLGSGRF